MKIIQQWKETHKHNALEKNKQHSKRHAFPLLKSNKNIQTTLPTKHMQIKNKRNISNINTTLSKEMQTLPLKNCKQKSKNIQTTLAKSDAHQNQKTHAKNAGGKQERNSVRKTKIRKKEKQQNGSKQACKQKIKNMQTVLWGESKQKIAWRTKKHAKDAQKHANNACK